MANELHAVQINNRDGSSTTYDIADATARASLEGIDEAITSKANAAGEYPGLLVGSAEQLHSSVTIDESEPYAFRSTAGSVDVASPCKERIVGGVIHWNQLVSPEDVGSAKTNGVTYTNNGDGSWSLSGTSTAAARKIVSRSIPGTERVGHVFYFSAGMVEYGASYQLMTMHSSLIGYASSGVTEKIFRKTTSSTLSLNIRTLGSGVVTDGVTFWPQLFDLTQMFGAPVADALFELEGPVNNSTGRGIAVFRKLFPKKYYAYSEGVLLPVNVSGKRAVGFNAYNHATGTAKVVGAEQYQITGSYTALSLDGEVITPDSDGYFTPVRSGLLNVTGGDNSTTCVHLVWDGERDGKYAAYEEHTYPLDSSLELLGVPVFADGKLRYNGDTYASDGTVTRKYGIVDLGDLTWSKETGSDPSIYRFRATVSGMKPWTDNGTAACNAICSKYGAVSVNSTYDGTGVGLAVFSTGSVVAIRDPVYDSSTAAEFATAMSGVKLTYELATPYTETAEPFESSQWVDDFGTEEFIQAVTRDVDVPVGHDSIYPVNLKAKLELAPDNPDEDGDYVLRREDGANTYVPLSQIADEAIVVVDGETPVVVAEEGKRYICGEVSELTFTPCASGLCEVRFTSGTTPPAVTVPNTVKWPTWFDLTALAASTTYEISIADGVYGAVMTWPI